MTAKRLDLERTALHEDDHGLISLTGDGRWVTYSYGRTALDLPEFIAVDIHEQDARHLLWIAAYFNLHEPGVYRLGVDDHEERARLGESSEFKAAHPRPNIDQGHEPAAWLGPVPDHEGAWPRTVEVKEATDAQVKLMEKAKKKAGRRKMRVLRVLPGTEPEPAEAEPREAVL